MRRRPSPGQATTYKNGWIARSLLSPLAGRGTVRAWGISRREAIRRRDPLNFGACWR